MSSEAILEKYNFFFLNVINASFKSKVQQCFILKKKKKVEIFNVSLLMNLLLYKSLKWHSPPPPSQASLSIQQIQHTVRSRHLCHLENSTLASYLNSPLLHHIPSTLYLFFCLINICFHWTPSKTHTKQQPASYCWDSQRGTPPPQSRFRFKI